MAVNREFKQLVRASCRTIRWTRPDAPTFLLRDARSRMGTQDQGCSNSPRGGRSLQPRGRAVGQLRHDLFEARARNVWVATLNGLDHFREFAVARISSKQSLSTDVAESVLASQSGGLWIGTLGGLNHWVDGRILPRPIQVGPTNDTVASLFEDSGGRIWMSSPRGLSVLEHGRAVPIGDRNFAYVQAMAEDAAGRLWLSDQERGLVSVVNRRVLDAIPWSRLGNRTARSLVFDATRGGLWLGFFQGGLSFFKDGRISASYGKAEGLGEGQVSSLRIDRDDALWAATSGGLSRLKNDRIATTAKTGCCACALVHGGRDGHLWLDTVCGLLRIARTEIDAGAQSAAAHGLSPSTIPMASRTTRRFPPTARRSRVQGTGSSSSPQRGRRTARSCMCPYPLRPPLHIERVTPDRTAYRSRRAGCRLVRDLRIDYTAPSHPERVRFRYKLEGHDAEWIDAGNRQRAFIPICPGSRIASGW